MYYMGVCYMREEYFDDGYERKPLIIELFRAKNGVGYECELYFDFVECSSRPTQTHHAPHSYENYNNLSILLIEFGISGQVLSIGCRNTPYITTIHAHSYGPSFCWMRSGALYLYNSIHNRNGKYNGEANAAHTKNRRKTIPIKHLTPEKKVPSI